MKDFTFDLQRFSDYTIAVGDISTATTISISANGYKIGDSDSQTWSSSATLAANDTIKLTASSTSTASINIVALTGEGVTAAPTALTITAEVTVSSGTFSGITTSVGTLGAITYTASNNTTIDGFRASGTPTDILKISNTGTTATYSASAGTITVGDATVTLTNLVGNIGDVTVQNSSGTLNFNLTVPGDNNSQIITVTNISYSVSRTASSYSGTSHTLGSNEKITTIDAGNGDDTINITDVNSALKINLGANSKTINITWSDTSNTRPAYTYVVSANSVGAITINNFDVSKDKIVVSAAEGALASDDPFTYTWTADTNKYIVLNVNGSSSSGTITLGGVSKDNIGSITSTGVYQSSDGIVENGTAVTSIPQAAATGILITGTTGVDNYTIGGANGQLFSSLDSNNEAQNIDLSDYNQAVSTLNAGAGADNISVGADIKNVTIIGGKGDDTIEIADREASSTIGNWYQYTDGDNSDVIIGFNSHDTLQILGGSYSTSMKGADFIVKVGERAITMKDMQPGMTFTVVDSDSNSAAVTVPYLWQGDSNVDSVVNDNSGASDTTNNTIQAYVIDLGANADTVRNGGSYVSIGAGSGADYIFLSDTGVGVTVNGGLGNDLIFAGDSDTNGVYTSNVGHTYQYSPGDGDDTIRGLNASDTIVIYAATFETLATNGFFKISVGTGSITFDAPVDTPLNIVTVSDGTSGSANGFDKIPRIYQGTSSNEDMGAFTLSGDANGAYTIQGLGGDDTIASSGTSVYIDAGAGNDFISLGGASGGATIFGGEGNDTIQSTATDGIVYKYDVNTGNDVIKGYKGQDTLYFNATPTSATVDSSGNYIFSFTSGTLTLESIAGGTNLNVFINGTRSNDYTSVPKETLGTYGADTFTNTADDWTINALAGNDTISNSGGNVSINAGSGNDFISLEDGKEGVTVYGGAGNDTIDASNNTLGGNYVGVVYEYNDGDGDDVIKGFNDLDTLKLDVASGTLLLTVAAGDDTTKTDFVIKTASGGSITIKDFDVDKSVTVIYTDGAGVIYMPKIVAGGTSGNDNLNNTGDEFSVSSGEGNDTITNSGNKATINAGAGADSIVQSGNEGYIDAGADNDVISLGATASANTVNGGAGNDTIYVSSTLGNTFIFNTDSGDDVIRGINLAQRIDIGTNELTALSVDFSNRKVVLKLGDASLTLQDSLGNPIDGGTVLNIISNGVEHNYQLPLKIEGSGVAETIDNGEANFTISAFGGNDTIYNSGANVLIDAGAGNDTVSLYGGAAGTTVIGGAGNDFIYGKDGGQVYVYNSGDGKDTIKGFNSADTLKIGVDFTTSVTADGLLINVSGGSILLQDASGGSIEGGTDLNIIASDNILHKVTVEKIIRGTSTHDSNLVNDKDSHLIDAMAGDDTITNSGGNVTIDAGAGNDVISLGGGKAGVIIDAGTGNDSISADEVGHTYLFGQAEGTDTIRGFNPDDTIVIKEGSEYSTNITDDNKFQVKIGSTEIFLYDKDGKVYGADGNKNRIFTVATINASDGSYVKVATETVPSIKRVDSTNHTLQAINNNDTVYTGYTFEGSTAADTIEVSSKDISIEAGAGHDSIKIGGNNYSGVTINAGTGNDFITVADSVVGHTFVYASGDAKDTIEGFNGQDVIKFTNIDAIAATSLTAEGNFLISISSSDQILLKDAARDTPVHITFANGTSTILTVPRGQTGITNNSTDPNTVEAALLTGTNADDTIVNNASDVTIFADAGNDSILSNGIAASINAGAGNDTVSLGANAQNVTINAAAGNDAIYANSSGGHLYQFKAGDGFDTIYNFSSNDSIQILDDSTLSTPTILSDGVIFTLGSSTIKIAGDIGGTSLNLIASDSSALTPVTIDRLKIVATSGSNSLSINNTGSNTDDFTLQGSGYNDSISNTGNKVTIDAQNGADLIKNDGTSVSINAGDGNDTISLGSSAQNNTINGGLGNDYIIGNSSGHVYIYDGGQGNDTIRGLTENDTLRIRSTAAITSEVIKNYDPEGDVNYEDFKIKVGNTGSITLEKIAVDTKVHVIYDSVGTVNDSTTTVQASDYINVDKVKNVTSSSHSLDNAAVNGDGFLLKGTTGEDTITNAADSVTISGDRGNDRISNTGANVYIDGGSGADVISLSGAKQGVTVAAGVSNDTIYATDGVGHVYKFGSADGENVIIGFTKDDTILLGDSNHDSESFTDGNGTNNIYGTISGSDYVLNISGTKVTLRANETTAIAGGTSFTVAKSNGTFFGNLTVANVILPGSGNNAINNANFTDDNYTLSGGSGNDVIGNAGASVTIYGNAGDDSIRNAGSASFIDGGAGNDTISIVAGAENNTIHAGFGNDLINSNGQGGHVYQFSSGEGTNTIMGVAAGDTFQILDGSTISTPTRDASGTYTMKIGSTNVVLPDVAAGTSIAVQTLNGGTFVGAGNVTFAQVKIVPTSGTTSLTNDANSSDYSIQGSSAADTIENYAAYVTIDAGSGADVITNGGANVSIDAGGGNDTISLTADANDVTVIGGKNNDYIIGNTSGRTSYVYSYGDGNDTIENFTSGDRLYIKGDYQTSVVANNDDGTEDFLISLSSSSQILLKSVAVDTPLGIFKVNNDGTVATSPTEETVYRLKNVSKGATLTNEAGAMGDNYSLKGGSTADFIVNKAVDVTIDAANGNDTIINSAEGVMIFAGEGNDVVSLSGGAAEVTVSVGAGNDVIYAETVVPHTYQFNVSDGNNTIIGFHIADTIEVAGTTFANDNALLGSVSGEVTHNGYELTIGETKVLLTESEESKSLSGGSSFVVKYYDGSAYQSYQITTQKEMVSPTNSNTTLNAVNDVDGYSITGSSVDDTIMNSGSDVTIDAADGNDLIINSGTNVTISGGEGNDTIILSETASNVTVNGGAGDDYIKGSSGGNVYVFQSGDGNDTVEGFTENDTLSIAAGYSTVITKNYDGTDSDKVDLVFKVGDSTFEIKKIAVDTTFKVNDANYIVPRIMQGTSAADSLVNERNDSFSILAGAGNDTVENKGNSVTVSAGEGADLIYNSGTNVVVLGEAGNDTIINAATGAEATLDGGAGNSWISNAAADVSIVATSGANSVNNSGVSATINVGSGNDTIINNGATSSINAGNGNNYVSIGSNAEDVTVRAGSGRDTIIIDGANAYVDAGAGNNLITMGSGASYATVSIGSGNDTITGSNDGGNVFVLDVNSGNNVITNFNEADQIKINIANNALAITSEVTTSGIAFVFSDTSANKVTKLTVGGASGDQIIEIRDADNKAHNVTVPFALLGTSGNDYLYVDNELAGDYTIQTYAGNDTVYNPLNGAVIDVTDSENNNANDGANDIVNGGNNVSVYAGSGNDTIGNSGANVTIDAGNGNNYVGNQGAAAIINTGSGNDTIDNQASDVTITAGAGNDSIRNTTVGAYVDAGAGNDTIIFSADASGTINAGAGNDSIYAESSGHGEIVYKYATGEGTDTIVGFASNDKILIDAGTSYTTSISSNNSDTTIIIGSTSVKLQGYGAFQTDGTTHNTLKIVKESVDDNGNVSYSTDTVTIPSYYNFTSPAASGNNTVTIDSNYVFADAAAGADRITNTGNNNIIYGGAGTDSLTNSGEGVYISGGNDNDTIVNTAGEGVQLYGDAGNDQISITGGSNILADGGAGNDTIRVEDGSNVTVGGGAGNDVFSDTNNSNAVTYVYTSGNDTLYGFKKENINTLIIPEGAYFANADFSTVNSDFLVTVTGATGSNLGIITFKGVESTDTFKLVKGSSAAETYTVPKIKQLTSAANNYTTAETDTGYVINALAGNDTITNATTTELTINGGTGNDIIFNSGTSVVLMGGDGADRIVNAGDTVTVDGGTGDDSIINNNNYVSISGGAGADRITLTGGDNVTIRPGAGNDTIWNSDTSSGKVYQFGANEGSNVIVGFADEDTIQIMTDASIIADVINTGTVLTIRSGNYNTIVTLQGALAGNTVNIEAGSDSYVLDTTSATSVIGSGGVINNILAFTASNDTVTVSTEQSGYILKYLGGNDVITNEVSNVTIDAGAGNDTIHNNAASVSLNGGDGADRINNSGTNVVIVTGGGNDTVINSEDATGVTIDALASSITSAGSTVSVAGANRIDNYADSVTVIGSYGNDTINNSGTSVLITSEGRASDVGVTSISGGANRIVNSGNSDTIITGAGADTIINTGGNVTIDAGAGNDVISLNSGSNGVTVEAGEGNDRIVNSDTDGAHTYVFTGSSIGADTITNFNVAKDTIKVDSGVEFAKADYLSGTNFTVTLKSGNTSVGTITFNGVTYGDNISAKVGNNDSTIVVPSGYAGTTGNETINVSTLNTAINAVYALAGNDTILNDRSGNSAETKLTLDGGDGNDRISNTGESIANAVIFGGAGADTIINNATNTSIFGDSLTGEGTVSGADNIYNSGTSVTIVTGAGNDTVRNSGSDVVIDADAYSIRTVNGTDTEVSVAGNNRIENYGGNVSIRGGRVNDTIITSGNSVTVDAGEGNDIISIVGGDSTQAVTVYGGAGNDTIYNSDTVSASTHVYQYGTNDGNDVIVNYTASTDKIQVLTNAIITTSIIAGGFAISLQSDASTETSRITLRGVAGGDVIKFEPVLSENNTTRYSLYSDTSVLTDETASALTLENNVYSVTVPRSVVGSTGNDTINHSLSGTSAEDKYIVNALAGNDRIVNSGTFVSIVTGAGNDTVINYDTGSNVTIDALASSVNAAGTSTVSVAGNNLINNYASTVTVIGSYGNDTINNSGTSVLITSAGRAAAEGVTSITGGNNRIVNSGTTVTITTGAGADTIINYGGSTKITTGAGADVISLQAGDGVTVDAGEGNDRIINNDSDSSHTYVFTGSSIGADTITNFNIAKDTISVDSGVTFETAKYLSGSNLTVTLKSSEGASIGTVTFNGVSYGNVISVTGGAAITVPSGYAGTASNETINTNSITGANAFYALAGNDTIINGTVAGTSATPVTIDAGDGADRVYNSGTYVSIITGAGNDTIFNQAENVTVDALAVSVNAAGTSTVSVAGNNLINNEGASSSIILGYGNDTVNNSGSNVKIESATVNESITGGANRIVNSGTTVTITTGAGNDTVINYGNTVNITTGAGNDVISLQAGESSNSVTVDAGAGNDRIVNSDTDGAHTYVFTGSSIGADTIVGFTENDKIKFDGYTGATISLSGAAYLSGSSYVATVTSTTTTTNEDEETVTTTSTLGTIMFSGVSLGQEIAIEGGTNFTIPSAAAGTTGNDTINTSATSYANATAFYALAGNDTIINETASVTVDAGDGADRIYNSGTSVVIITGTGNDTVLNAEDASSTTIDAYATVSATNRIENEANNVSIRGGNVGVDSIISSGNNVEINAEGGTNNISITGGTTVTVDGGDGSNRIVNSGTTVTITTGASVDNIINYGNGVMISTGAGNDNISLQAGESSNSVTVDAGAGNDNIYNNDTDGSHVYLFTGDSIGNDVIYNFTANDKISLSGYTNAAISAPETFNGSNFTVTLTADITTGEGEDAVTTTSTVGTIRFNNGISFGQTITVEGADNIVVPATYTGSTGADTINTSTLEGATRINALAGNDTIINETASVTIDAGDGVDRVYNSGASVVIITGAGNDTVFNAGDSSTVNATSTVNSANRIENTGNSVSILGGNVGNDSIISSGNSVTIDAGEGSNFVTITGGSGVVTGGSGVDSVLVSGEASNVEIKTGAGADRISINSTGSGITIEAGAGNDNIYGTSVDGSQSITYKYAAGDGNDTIYNYKANDVLSITGGSVEGVSMSGNNLVVTVSDSDNSGTITIREIADGEYTFGDGTYTVENHAIVTEPASTDPSSPDIIDEPSNARSFNFASSFDYFENDELFADDNVIGNDASIADVSEITATNYSAGNIEAFNFNSLGLDNSFLASSDDKNKA